MQTGSSNSPDRSDPEETALYASCLETADSFRDIYEQASRSDALNSLETQEEIIARGIVSRSEYEQLEAYTRALFRRGTEMAAQKGLILVDTKYEFGKRDGRILLMDEIHTPDSSRYFYADGYEERLARGEKQKQLSKEFVREWLMANGFQGLAGQAVPEMTDEVVAGITDRYIELYEHITGENIEGAILSFLKG